MIFSEDWEIIESGTQISTYKNGDKKEYKYGVDKHYIKHQLDSSEDQGDSNEQQRPTPDPNLFSPVDFETKQKDL